MAAKWMINQNTPAACSYVPTDAEHIANILTHAVMIPLAIIISIMLMVKSAGCLAFFVAIIYGISLITLFTASTAFHTSLYLNNDRILLELLRKSDRSVIYLFIASCYSPWLMLAQLPEDKLFIHLRWIIWVLAGLGVLFELTYSKNFPILGIVFYLLYGMVPGLLLDSQMSFPGILELKLSGSAYLIGIMFFKSDGLVPFAHAIWHMCVILGVSIHYLTIYTHFYST